ncbi:hypothetical protein O181_016989 [Austropuccinia psidii MF-1]|uniref:Uncharacterized protein n=1 Tax=Austropuccinia psidii MF-1 TaxID=1389203 RepID=A0A9Q3C4X9_9BASI|nr:hypothetical protein [Austropuccinia psidii MF-1]
MHITEQLMRWGPLMGVSEFGGERLIGTLGKLKTNSINGAIEESIMMKFGKMQRLQHAFEMYEEMIVTKKKKLKIEEERIGKKTYTKLLRYLQDTIPTLQDYRRLPYNGPVLQN